MILKVEQSRVIFVHKKAFKRYQKINNNNTHKNTKIKTKYWPDKIEYLNKTYRKV